MEQSVFCHIQFLIQPGEYQTQAFFFREKSYAFSYKLDKIWHFPFFCIARHSRFSKRRGCFCRADLGYYKETTPTSIPFFSENAVHCKHAYSGGIFIFKYLAQKTKNWLSFATGAATPPTRPNLSQLQNPNEPHTICRSPDLEANKWRKGRSGMHLPWRRSSRLPRTGLFVCLSLCLRRAPIFRRLIFLSLSSFLPSSFSHRMFCQI